MAAKPPLTLAFNLPFNEAIAAAVARGTVLPDVYYGQLQGLARQQAFSIAGIASLDQLQAVNDSLKDFMAKGGSFKAWKKQSAVLDLNLPAHRLDNIWRTNLQGNYLRGHWQQFVENAASRPYLMYDAINDSRVRPSHLAHDGTIRAVGDAFWKTHSPPLGYRCRCNLISLTEEQATARSRPNPDGAGTGLYKTPQLEGGIPAEPDKGWDYNPFEDRLGPLRKSLERFDPKLKAVGAKKLAQTTVSAPHIPVANALELPKSGKVKAFAKTVLETIDTVHSDGKLPRIPIKQAGGKFQGVYRPSIGGGAHSIGLNTQRSVNPELTIAHEIGHFLDHQGFGKAGTYSSQVDAAFAEWREAIKNSQATKTLEAVNALGSAQERKSASYYLTPWEQWARSYAQWLATRSGNQTMKDQVLKITKAYWSKPYQASQWDEADFEAIAKAIDKLFELNGWLK